MIPGRMSGKQHKPSEERFAGKVARSKRQRRRNSKRERDHHGSECNQKTVAHGFPNRGIVKQNSVPLKRQVTRRKAAHAGRR